MIQDARAASSGPDAFCLQRRMLWFYDTCCDAEGSICTKTKRFINYIVQSMRVSTSARTHETGIMLLLLLAGVTPRYNTECKSLPDKSFRNSTRRHGSHPQRGRTRVALRTQQHTLHTRINEHIIGGPYRCSIRTRTLAEHQVSVRCAEPEGIYAVPKCACARHDGHHDPKCAPYR